MTGAKPEKFLWLSQHHVTDPRLPYVQVLRDYWWPVNAEGKIAFWGPRLGRNIYSYPQANQNREIAERLKPPGTVDVIQIPLALVPIDLQDYDDSRMDSEDEAHEGYHG